MSVRNSNGHNVTNMAGHHNQDVVKANLQMPDQMGKMGYNGGSKSGGNFPGSRKTKVASSAPAQGQNGMAWAPGNK